MGLPSLALVVVVVIGAISGTDPGSAAAAARGSVRTHVPAFRAFAAIAAAISHAVAPIGASGCESKCKLVH